ncbi:MAG: T9SS type A sorting domain-containing protein [Fulvivirga sp.]
MKSFFIIITLNLVFCLNLFGQQNKSRINNQNNVKYSLIDIWHNDNWVESGKYEYSYDNQKNLTLKSLYSKNTDGSWKDSHWKMEYIYNDAGLIEAQIEHRYEYSIQVFYEYDMYEYEYNQDGLTTVITHFQWFPFLQQLKEAYSIEKVYNNSKVVSTTQFYYDWETLQHRKVFKQYDTHGRLENHISYIFSDDDGEWENQTKFEFSFDDLNGSGLGYYWQNEVWNTSSRYTIIYNSNYFKLNEIEESYNSNLDEWTNYKKIEITRDNNGNAISEIHYQVNSDNEWVYNKKYENSYFVDNELEISEWYEWDISLNEWYGLSKVRKTQNSDGLKTSDISYNWGDTGWEIDNKKIFTYNEDNLATETVYQEYVEGSLINKERERFYYTELVTSINPINDTQTIQIYPSPSRDHIFVSLTSESRENYSWSILSMDGTVQLSGTLMSNREKISTATLSKGVYILTLKTNQGSHKTYKILKE